MDSMAVHQSMNLWAFYIIHTVRLSNRKHKHKKMSSVYKASGSKFHRTFTEKLPLQLTPCHFNLLKPTCYVKHQRFNIQEFLHYATLYWCVLYLNHIIKPLFNIKTAYTHKSGTCILKKLPSEATCNLRIYWQSTTLTIQVWVASASKTVISIINNIKEGKERGHWMNGWRGRGERDMEEVHNE
jgi:hypothetical protein